MHSTLWSRSNRLYTNASATPVVVRFAALTCESPLSSDETPSLLNLLDEPQEPSDGAVRSGGVELEWNPTGLRVRITEEEWTVLSEVASVQLSRSVRFKPRFFRKPREIHRVHLEIRASGTRIRLQAVAPDPSFLEELPSMDAGGEEVSLRGLVSAARAARWLGGRVAEWNREAVEELSRLPTAPMNEGWVQVASYFSPVDAHIARVALEGEGIAALIQDENTVSVDPLQAIALGGVKVLVRESDVEDAVVILQR